MRPDGPDGSIPNQPAMAKRTFHPLSMRIFVTDGISWRQTNPFSPPHLDGQSICNHLKYLRNRPDPIHFAPVPDNDPPCGAPWQGVSGRTSGWWGNKLLFPATTMGYVGDPSALVEDDDRSCGEAKPTVSGRRCGMWGASIRSGRTVVRFVGGHKPDHGEIDFKKIEGVVTKAEGYLVFITKGRERPFRTKGEHP